MSPTEAPAHTSIEVTIDPDWIRFVTNDSDIFMQQYCGSWAFGSWHDKRLGWLVFDQGDDALPSERQQRKARKAWRAGEPLPAGWYRFNVALAVAAYAWGYKRGGADWYSHGDGCAYDVAIQKAIFGGEVKYA